MNGYGAIAYSVKTGRFGYSYGYAEAEVAKQVALQNCEARDATILCCSSNCWMALARSKSSKAYGWGFENSWKDATDRAILECDKYSVDSEIVICFSTIDGKQITIPELLQRQSSFDNTNPRQIERNLRLPSIRASLIVRQSTHQKGDWHIQFFVPGPDRRYNPGVAIVPSYNIPKLVRELNEAYRKMKLLKSTRYKPDFSEEFIARGEVSDTLAVKVCSWSSYYFFSRKTKVRLNFLVSSKTHTFRCALRLDETRKALEILSSAEDTADKVLSELQID